MPVPLPSLGVSSLDLGRSYILERPLFLPGSAASAGRTLFGGGPGNLREPLGKGAEVGDKSGKMRLDRLEVRQLGVVRLVHVEGAVDLDLQGVEAFRGTAVM